MKQEDLMNLKIEDLTPITKLQVFEDPRYMFVWDREWASPIKELVYSIINYNGSASPVVCRSSNIATLDFCAEIPKPQTRGMESLEVMEYLHTLQLYLSAYIKPGNFSPPDNISFDDFKSGSVISKRQNLPGVTYSWSTGHTEKSKHFGILKNGKVTEFKIPQIEA